MSVSIINPDFVVLDAHRLEKHSHVLIEGNRIAAIGPDISIPPDAEQIDARGCAVIPGLVNAHTHLYQNLIKGIGDGLSLVDWCNVALFPTMDAIFQEQRGGNPRPSYLWSALASIEMIRSGITCCQDMGLSRSWEGVTTAWRDVGIRGVAALTLADRWIPEQLRHADQLRQETLDCIRAYHHPDTRITVALGPSGAFLCSDELLEWISATAETYDLGIHIHVAETAGEVEDELRETGMRPPERLDRVGLLGANVSAVHCVHISSSDRELLARREVSIVHCPKSNMKLADGIAPIPSLRSSGLRIALGTDGAASNDLLDMWEEMRAAVLLARVGSGDAAALAPADAFEMATAAGAHVCRVGAGTLEAGRLADLAIIDLSGAHLRPCHDPLATLVYCTRAGDVRDTIVDGSVVMRDRRILSVDEPALVKEAEAVGRDLLARRRAIV